MRQPLGDQAGYLARAALLDRWDMAPLESSLAPAFDATSLGNVPPGISSLPPGGIFFFRARPTKAGMVPSTPDPYPVENRNSHEGDSFCRDLNRDAVKTRAARFRAFTPKGFRVNQ